MLKQQFKNAHTGIIKIRDQLSERFIERVLPKTGGNHAFAIVIAIIVGVLGAYGAIFFRFLIQWSHTLFFQTDDSSIAHLQSMPAWQLVLLPTAGALLVGIIVTRFAPEVKGSGIPEVMQSMALKGGMIRLRVLLTKSIAAALTIGSGGSAGREGPIVHIGSAIGSAIGQFIGVSPRHIRTFVACGAAAGIAATFNAPIAGALFAMEVIVGEMRVVSLPPIVIASVIATVISRFYLGDFPAFQVPAYDTVSFYELGLYAVLGILAGIVSTLFIKTFIRAGTLFSDLNLPGWLKPAIGGLGVGIIGIFVPHVFGVGYETINAALWGSLEIKLLLIIVVAKFIATSLSLGSGGSGGIFAPSLLLGSALGAAFGGIVHNVWPEWTASAGAYALVGMGAVVAGVTHAPISGILIIFELTNNYLIIPPLMLSAILALLISNRFCKKSIYLASLESRGIKLYDSREVNLLRSIRVQDVMDNNPILLKGSTHFSEILTTLLSGKSHYAIVVGAQDRYMGTIELKDIREVLQESESLSELVIAQDIVNTHTPYILKRDNLDLAMHLFGRHDKDEIAVCNNNRERKVIGVLTKLSVINAYNLRIFEEDLTGGFSSIVDTVKEGRTVEVFGDMHLAQIDIPSTWAGKTLRDLDLRRRHGLEIVLIYRQAGEQAAFGRPGLFPSPDLKLRPGDQLLVMSTLNNINKISRR